MITDDPGTPGGGHWEINVGMSTERRAGSRVSEMPLLDLNYGIGNAVQIKYEVPHLVTREDGAPRQSGLGNSEVGVKWRFLDEEKATIAMSVYPQVEFNNPGSSSDDRGLVEHATAFLLPVQIEKSFGEFTTNFQFGREFRSGGDSWFYGAGVSRAVHEKVEVGIELAGAASSRFDRSHLILNAGISYEIGPKTSFMISIGRELHNHDEPRATLIGYIGWQWRL